MALSFFGGGLLGSMAHTWWKSKTEPAKQRIPRQWPLNARPLVNALEQSAWHWLTTAFPEHHVMLKVPVTRFTKPQKGTSGRDMFQLLDGVYCSFTVCGADGRVIGCVDVPGPAGLSISNQTLKHSLLSQCDIRYWVVDGEHLPSVVEIRTAFLGPQALKRDDEEHARTDARFLQSRAHLQALLSRQRHISTAKSGSRDTAASQYPSHLDAQDSMLSSGWRHNSFLAPLDSRLPEEAPAKPVTRRVRAGSSPDDGGY